MFVVTGGGTGIGRAVALALDEAGEDVLVTGRRVEPLKSVANQGGRIRFLRCDNARVEDVMTLVGRVDAPVRGLVHCAGGNPAIGRPDPASLHDEVSLLNETIGGNLTSAVLTAVALEQKLADDASVVLFGSIAAERGVGYYGPAKAAVGSYAVGLAARLGSRGIRVNCISPGYIADTEFFRGGMTEAREEQLRAQTLLGRVGAPDDVVAATLFLLSPASRHVTAQTIHLNGGAFTSR